MRDHYKVIMWAFIIGIAHYVLFKPLLNWIKYSILCPTINSCKNLVKLICFDKNKIDGDLYNSNYIFDKNNKCVFLMGGWGIGKTWHYRKNIVPTFNSRPIYISCFSATRDQLINQLIISNPIYNIITLHGILSSLIKNSWESFMPNKKIIVFDDLERLHTENNPNYKDLMAIICFLKEQNKCRILLIGNKEKIKSEVFNEYLEKIVDSFIVVPHKKFKEVLKPAKNFYTEIEEDFILQLDEVFKNKEYVNLRLLKNCFYNLCKSYNKFVDRYNLRNRIDQRIVLAQFANISKLLVNVHFLYFIESNLYYEAANYWGNKETQNINMDELDKDEGEPIPPNNNEKLIKKGRALNRRLYNEFDLKLFDLKTTPLPNTRFMDSLLQSNNEHYKFIQFALEKYLQSEYDKESKTKLFMFLAIFGDNHKLLKTADLEKLGIWKVLGPYKVHDNQIPGIDISKVITLRDGENYKELIKSSEYQRLQNDAEHILSITVQNLLKNTLEDMSWSKKLFIWGLIANKLNQNETVQLILSILHTCPTGEFIYFWDSISNDIIEYSIWFYKSNLTHQQLKNNFIEDYQNWVQKYTESNIEFALNKNLDKAFTPQGHGLRALEVLRFNYEFGSKLLSTHPNFIKALENFIILTIQNYTVLPDPLAWYIKYCIVIKITPHQKIGEYLDDVITNKKMKEINRIERSIGDVYGYIHDLEIRSHQITNWWQASFSKNKTDDRTYETLINISINEMW